MELEVKYAIPDKGIADDIWNDDFVASIADTSSAEKLVMKAVYFDTEDYRLSNKNVTVRVRAEGERIIGTLKYGGSTKNGLAEREEVNIPLVGEEYFIAPPIDMFKESQDGLDLMELIGDMSLINMLETRFLRRRVRLHYNSSLLELAVDTGEIITDAGNKDILEMEIELFTGLKEDLLELAEIIATRYNLVPENRSKFSRGLALLKGK